MKVITTKILENRSQTYWSVFLVFILAAALFYNNPDQFVSDSSLFYPVVADNIWTTGISTFNGYIETNGYQPLWMLVSVLSVAISSFFSLNTLMVIGFFYHLFLLGAIIVTFKIAKRWPFFNAPVVAITLIFMFIANGVLHNMESAMALFFVLLTMYYALKMEDVRPRQFFIFGFLVGMTFLSRLDLLFFGMLITLYLFFIWRKELKENVGAVLAYVSGFALLTLPYLSYNLLHFDQLLPMFNRLEQGLPTLEYAWANIYPYGAVSLVIAMVEWGIAWSAKTRQARVFILVMSVSTILQIVYVAFFQHVQSWYFITGFINFAFIIGYLLMKINQEWLNKLVFAMLVVMTAGSAYLKTVSNYALSAHVLRLYQDKVGTAEWLFSDVSEKRKYAEDVKKVLPAKTTVAVGYFPGSVAYYGDLKVFAANGLSDGLIANYSLDKELIANGIEKTMKKYNVQYQIIPLSNGAVLWYGRIGFDVLKDGGYKVMNYSKLQSDKCAMMLYSPQENIEKVKLSYASTGYAGVFPVKEMLECPNERVKYSTVIGK